MAAVSAAFNFHKDKAAVSLAKRLFNIAAVSAAFNFHKDKAAVSLAKRLLNIAAVSAAFNLVLLKLFKAAK